jgi:hypothetical protein
MMDDGQALTSTVINVLGLQPITMPQALQRSLAAPLFAQA